AESSEEAPAPQFQTKGHIALGGSLERYHQAEAVATGAVSADLLEAAVDEILNELDALFREITYDRVRLSAWLGELARVDDPAPLAPKAVRMLVPVVELEPDRELRYRTLTESVMALAEPLRTAMLTTWLMPAVRSDVNIVKLLSRFSGDDFAELAGLTPIDVLQQPRADSGGAPVEEWIRTRLSESLEDAIAERQVAVAPLEPLITEDDPALARLREAAHAASAPGRVLAHSLDVRCHLVRQTQS